MYLLDANVLIEAKNRYYPFDIVPGFWEWIEQMHTEGKVFSVPDVRTELLRVQDELSDWTKSLPDGFFLEPDADTELSFYQLSNWAKNHPNYTALAVQEFFDAADYTLAAYADAHGFTVVTEEGSSPDSKKRIFLPDACRHLDVPSINTFELIRIEKPQFAFGSGS